MSLEKAVRYNDQRDPASLLLRMQSKTHENLQSWSPVSLMAFGAISVLLGMCLADLKYGHQCHQIDQQQTDDLMDILGKSVYADITGPFTVHQHHIEYTECILAGSFEVSEVFGSCQDLSKAGIWTPSRDTVANHSAFLWDLSSCMKFMEGDEKSEFLEPRPVNVRQQTSDLADALHALCSEDMGYLRILAQHLPSDRPLLTLDAGAHIGIETLLLARFNRFQGKVLAIEPHPASAKILFSNTNEEHGTISRIPAVLTSNEIAAQRPSLRLSGSEGQFSSWRVQLADGGGDHGGAVDVPTITLQRVLDFTRSKKFDIIKLDIGGMESQLMADPASRAILCKATCLVITLDTGVDSDKQYNDFVATGCPTSHRLVEVGVTGRYKVLCQDKTVLARTAQLRKSNAAGVASSGDPSNDKEQLR